MALVVQLQVFTPEEAKLHGHPYEVRINVAGASPEQMASASLLLAQASERLALSRSLGDEGQQDHDGDTTTTTIERTP